MIEIVRWVVWVPTFGVAALIGVLHLFGLSIPKAIRGNDDGPSHIPLIGELAFFVAFVALPRGAGRGFWIATGAVCAVWFLDYSARGICAFRQRLRRRP